MKQSGLQKSVRSVWGNSEKKKKASPIGSNCCVLWEVRAQISTHSLLFGRIQHLAQGLSSMVDSCRWDRDLIPAEGLLSWRTVSYSLCHPAAHVLHHLSFKGRSSGAVSKDSSASSTGLFTCSPFRDRVNNFLYCFRAQRLIRAII